MNKLAKYFIFFIILSRIVGGPDCVHTLMPLLLINDIYHFLLLGVILIVHLFSNDGTSSHRC